MFALIRISNYGLATYPVKTVSLPANLLSIKERSGQGLLAQAEGTGRVTSVSGKELPPSPKFWWAKQSSGKNPCPSLSDL